ncbi:MAG: sugar phosphate isomerase/epimerase [candidate division NC10 bacterium]|nr:sugar phosphate isomerase/epimerase [candidate division NC10 bacterium]
MELGLNGATTLKADLATDIAVAGRAGFDFVEIWAAKLVGYLERGGLAALRRDLKRAGVKAATLNSVERVTFNDPSGHIRMQEDFRRFCRVAEAIGCETVIVVPSPRPKGVSFTAIERESVRVLRELSGIARPHGVRLAYEFLGFADCTVNTLAQCAAIVDRVARPNVGLVLDTFHFFAGGSRLDSIRQVDPRKIFMVHINDVERAPRRKMHDALRLFPGKGIIPLASILRALRAIGYAEKVSVEIFRPQYWDRPPLQVAREARAAALVALRQAGLS